jgi:hypothetical protein
MENENISPIFTIVDACGTPELQQRLAILEQNGYESGELKKEGQYNVRRIDGAAGWADWYYEIKVWEIPQTPVKPLFERGYLPKELIK